MNALQTKFIMPRKRRARMDALGIKLVWSRGKPCTAAPLVEFRMSSLFGDDVSPRQYFDDGEPYPN
jgi:hypothetical protein